MIPSHCHCKQELSHYNAEQQRCDDAEALHIVAYKKLNSSTILQRFFNDFLTILRRLFNDFSTILFHHGKIYNDSSTILKQFFTVGKYAIMINDPLTLLQWFLILLRRFSTIIPTLIQRSLQRLCNDYSTI